jgi:hypothetical protein
MLHCAENRRTEFLRTTTPHKPLALQREHPVKQAQGTTMLIKTGARRKRLAQRNALERSTRTWTAGLVM